MTPLYSDYTLDRFHCMHCLCQYYASTCTVVDMQNLHVHLYMHIIMCKYNFRLKYYYPSMIGLLLTDNILDNLTLPMTLKLLIRKKQKRKPLVLSNKRYTFINEEGIYLAKQYIISYW